MCQWRRSLNRAAHSDSVETVHGPRWVLLFLVRLVYQLEDGPAAHHRRWPGILVSTGDAFATGARTPNAIRVALATPSIHDLPALLDRCRDILLAC